MDSFTESEFQPIEYTEASLLSIIINSKDNELFLKVFENLNMRDFSSSFHSRVFEILVDLVIKNNLTIDKTAISSKIKGMQYKKILDEIISLDSPLENVDHYISEIKNDSLLRKIKVKLSDINVKMSTDNDVRAYSLISEIEDSLIDLTSKDKDEFSTPKDILPSILETINSKTKASELTTCFKTLDLCTGGIDVGYHILAARPSVGKTEYALQMAVENAKLGHRSAIFSFEMNKKALTRRIVSNITGIPTHKLKSGDLTSDEALSLEKNLQFISSLPIHIIQCGGDSATEMASKAKRLRIRHNDLKLIIIDYIQMISGNAKDSETTQVTSISRTIKNTSNYLNIPIIALSQLSRAVETREDKRPKLSDLRQSGSLEQDADTVMFLYSEKYHDKTSSSNITEIILSKNRDGPLCTVYTKNNKESQNFVEVA